MSQESAAPAADVAATPSPADQAEVAVAQPPEAKETAVRAGAGQIDILLDADLPITVQLGTVQTQVRQLLSLGPGAVLKLDKAVGEPIDLLLRGVRFATGQLVVTGNQLGVRIREIIPPGGPG